MITEFPNCGYRRMDGLLSAMGLKVTEKRLRNSMHSHRVDPEGVLLRALQMNTTQRRKYQVPGVLSLWYIDGFHKLIRFDHFQHFHKGIGRYYHA